MSSDSDFKFYPLYDIDPAHSKILGSDRHFVVSFLAHEERHLNLLKRARTDDMSQKQAEIQDDRLLYIVEYQNNIYIITFYLILNLPYINMKNELDLAMKKDGLVFCHDFVFHQYKSIVYDLRQRTIYFSSKSQPFFIVDTDGYIEQKEIEQITQKSNQEIRDAVSEGDNHAILVSIPPFVHHSIQNDSKSTTFIIKDLIEKLIAHRAVNKQYEENKKALYLSFCDCDDHDFSEY